MPEMVALRGGLRVSLTALQFAWRLEDNGFTLRVDRGELVIAPASRLDPADAEMLRRHVAELVAIAKYVAPEVGVQ